MAKSRRCCVPLVERQARGAAPVRLADRPHQPAHLLTSADVCAPPEIHVICGDLSCGSCIVDSRCVASARPLIPCAQCDEWCLVRRKAAAKAESTAKQNWAYPGAYRPVSGRPSAVAAAGFRRMPGCSAVACAPGRAGALSHAQLSLRPLLRQPTVLRTCAGA